MDIVEISYIDTAELDGYIREALKRWEKSESTGWGTVGIQARRVWRDESSTKAVYYCPFNYHSQYSGPTVLIYVDYDEVDMTGTIEIEYLGRFSHRAKEDLTRIFNEVIGNFDPSIAPLPFGVKCPHCGARYVYRKRIGVVECQNCAKSFDLELQEKAHLETAESIEGDINESRRRIIAVDASKIPRCKWCGSIEDLKFRYGQFGNAYCSKDCFLADSVEVNMFFGFCFVFLVPLIFIVVMSAVGPVLEFIVLIILFWMMSIFSIPAYKQGKKVREDVPKSSREP